MKRFVKGITAAALAALICGSALTAETKTVARLIIDDGKLTTQIGFEKTNDKDKKPAEAPKEIEPKKDKKEHKADKPDCDCEKCRKAGKNPDFKGFDERNDSDKKDLKKPSSKPDEKGKGRKGKKKPLDDDKETKAKSSSSSKSSGKKLL